MCTIRLIGITGGIGSGKSVVRRMLESMGYAVYDSDSRAKALMDGSEAIRGRLEREFGSGVMCGGCIDRKALAAVVFNDRERLRVLNGIVHGAVLDDIKAWMASQPSGSTCFVETALLYESGLNGMVSEVWEVTAPVGLRTERVMARSGLSRAEVEARMASQVCGRCAPVPPTHEIVNDGVTAVLPQVLGLLDGVGVAGDS